MDREMRIRPVADADWDGIVTLEAGAYTPLGLCEGRAALVAKVRASPATCFVLDAGRRPAGYLLALPYPESAYPELADRDESVLDSPNLHLHDLVVAEELRGRGLGRRLLGRLTADARARGYERISLVAVGGSHTFWSANGFTAHDGIADPRSYGAGSVYMSMPLPPWRTGRQDRLGAPPSAPPTRDEVGPV
ncbi:GNAT family N-acetyltransferase [Streptomyces sp. V4-01]|uniref:GNAT family N-acetyltransferase n=1 Tax=Actinacidiphila polyblastidii TaxID=3110430 RepID=A0ABU7PD16_9ACTN|nr:GNAT family N-acetyltransferase [Streptomyces sp. V4-01]